MVRTVWVLAASALMMTVSASALAQSAGASSGANGGANGGARLILFGATNFEGESRAFSADVPDLGARSVRAGDFAASAMAYGVWQVCMDAGYRTRCRQISGPVADLGADRQSISSIRLIRPPTPQELRAELPSAGSAPQPVQMAASAPTAAPAPAPAPARLVLFNLAGFRGGTREIDRDVANLGDRQWDAGDFAGSLVAVGEWEVCMDSNFRTRCRRVSGEVSDLGRDAQSISSVRIIRRPTQAEAAAGEATLARIQAPPPAQAAAQAPPAGQPQQPQQAQQSNPVGDAAGRIANDAARAAEQRASEEAQRRARQAVGSIFGGNRN